MKIVVRIIVLIVALGTVGIINSTASTGWQRIDADLYAVAHVDDHTLICVGELGKIIRSDNGGATWQWVAVPQQDALFTVAFGTQGKGVAAGESGAVLHSADRGETWTPVSSPVEEDIVRVRFATGDTVYAAGSEGTVLRSADGGATWAVVLSEPGAEWWDISCPSAGVVVIGSTEGRVWRTDNAGGTWATITTDIHAAVAVVEFRDALYGIALAVGGDVLITEDGGRTWNNRAFSSSSSLFDLAWLNDSVAVAVGAPKVVMQTSDAGLSWQPVVPEGNFTNAVFFLGISAYNGRAAIAGSGNVVLLWNAPTGQWELNSHCYLGNAVAGTKVLWDAAMLHDSLCILVGRDNLLYGSRDGGTTWKPLPTPPYLAHYSDILVQDSLRCLLVDRNHGMTRTVDGGTTWERFTIGAYEYSAVVSPAPDRLYLLADTVLRIEGTPNPSFTRQTVLLSLSDGGAQWQSRYFPDLMSAGDMVWLNTETALFLAQPRYGAIRNVLLRTDNAGVSWDTLFSHEKYGLNALWALDDSTVFCTGRQGLILYSTDQGKSWQTRESGTGATLADIAFLDRKRGFITGSDLADGSILVTTDGGLTWSAEQVSSSWNNTEVTPKLVYRVAVLNDTTVLLFGSGTIVRKHFTATTVGIHSTERGQANPYLYIAAMPNPAQGHARVRLYGLFSVAGKPLDLGVYDLFGRRVMDCSRSANGAAHGATAEFTVDFSLLPPGLYFMNLRVDGASCSRAVIVRR